MNLLREYAGMLKRSHHRMMTDPKYRSRIVSDRLYMRTKWRFYYPDDPDSRIKPFWYAK